MSNITEDDTPGRCTDDTQADVTHIDPHPVPGDTILVFNRQRLESVLSGQKTLAILRQPLDAGVIWLSHQRIIYGKAVAEKPFEITIHKKWIATRIQHHLDIRPNPGYGLPLRDAMRLRSKIVAEQHSNAFISPLDTTATYTQVEGRRGREAP